MKITYCIGNIYNSGGIERVLSNKANYLVNHGFEVSFIVIYQTDKTPFFYFDPRIKFHYLNFDFEKERGIKKKLHFKRNKKIFIERISQLLKEIKPDITISTYCKYSKYIYLADDGSSKVIERHFAKYKRAWYYAKFDKFLLGRMITYLYRNKDYRIVKHFDKFVVLTYEDKESWGNLPNIEVIENSMTFVPEKQSELINKRVIALGRLNQQKQFDKLIKIWSLIAARYPDWQLAIFGNGEKENALKNLINELNLQENVYIYPATSEVEKELTESSVYAMTSKYEGFGMVLVEAMSCGVPAVSFACKCGPRDIINDGEDGFLIPFNDLQAFADKLSVLIENQELRTKMGKAASQNILRYSEDTIMQKWISLFSRLVKK